MNYFPIRSNEQPTIYAYSDTRFRGQLKVGYTKRSAEERIREQYPIVLPENTYTIELIESSMRADGSSFTDKEVHDWLKRHSFINTDGEWFLCEVKDVRAAIHALRTRTENEEQRSARFGMRPEQKEAVERTARYFRQYKKEENRTPHFLWNCKMRFGKTFATYQLARKMQWKHLLIITFKPAVLSAWREDLLTHVDFEGWQFIEPREKAEINDFSTEKQFVCFRSFQDLLGKSKDNAVKEVNEWIHLINWDCVVFDEYHYGAWRERAKELFENENKDEMEAELGQGIELFDESFLPITTEAYLYLSGTPFRAINSGEFIEEQIYNWTYSDEQRAKEQWVGDNNPYASLPRMVMLTYQMPREVQNVAEDGEFDGFDLNTFFKAKGDGDNAKFLYQTEVQQWLNWIRGQFSKNIVDTLKQADERPPMPFSHAPLLHTLTHTLWYLPNVSACHAMANLLRERANTFYHDYKIVVAAGVAAGIGVQALEPVHRAMTEPLESKSITLTCGKLTTGVSVKPWTGIFMLRNLSSPESYFQAAFRVQTPWTMQNPNKQSPDNTIILKETCYIFDFAPDRALRQIVDYSSRLNIEEENPEKKVAEFINFLPILAYDGSGMRQIDAQGVLDIAMSGTTASLLARRWESALLVNVDNNTLRKLLENPEALHALMNIEGFRSLNEDIATIINKSEAVNKVKREKNKDELTKTQKKELSETEKETKSLRKQVQEKLIKFATRIPIFMYLTDYREYCLKDVITQLEPDLFRKVTGLSIADFELLVSLNLFNSSLMNEAIYNFKRYEDSSLSYLLPHSSSVSRIGLYDTVVEI